MSEKNSDRKNQTLLGGAMWLFLSMIIVKVIGAIFKIPLTGILGPIGKSYYSTAYNLFVPVYSIALAGLPVAISKTVAKYMALGRYKDVKNTFSASLRLTVITGSIGTVLMFLLAKPYVTSVNNHNAVYSILIIAPTIFFCCVMSAYRGYYNGLKNMIPSSVSEVIEALAKMSIGLVCAYAVMYVGMKNAVPGNNIFGLSVTDKTTHEEILSAIYPFAAAGGITGVTAGTLFSTLYLILRKKIKGNSFTSEEIRLSPPPANVSSITRELINVAVPIVASTVIFNLLNIIDSWTIQNRLSYLIANYSNEIQALYGSCLGSTPVADWQNYLYGAYETAVDFKNMVPTLTVALGVSAIPILSEAWTLKRKAVIKSSIESVIRMCMLISLPAGFGMAALSKYILTLLYSSSESVISAVPISSKIIFWYGIFVFIIAVSQPLTYMLQAIGKTKITVVSVGVGALIKVLLNLLLMSNIKINVFGAVISTVICYVVICIVDIIALIKYSEITINFKSVFFKPFFSALMCGLFAFESQKLISNVLSSRLSDQGLLTADNVGAVFAVAVAVIIYVICLLLTKTLLKSDINMLPKGEKFVKALEKYNLIG